MNIKTSKKIIAIIQARMSSKRFPGKALHKVNKKPLLQYIIERLKNIEFLKDSIIVATSKQAADNPIEFFCNKNNVKCYRGQLNNVAGRFFTLLEQYQCDAFIRISGDSPLIDHHLIEKGIKIFISEKYDIVTNILVRTFPKGQSVEIFDSNVFKINYKKIKAPDDLEHVSKYFYRNKRKYNLYNFTSGHNYQNVQLSVDTQQDMNTFKKIIKMMDLHHCNYSFDDILKIYRKLS